MVNPVRIAFIGAGIMGRHHLAVAERNPEIEIAGVAEDIAALGFNKAVAKLYELTGAIEKAAPSTSRATSAGRAARRLRCRRRSTADRVRAANPTA